MASFDLQAMAILTLAVNNADERLESYLNGMEPYDLRMVRNILLWRSRSNAWSGWSGRAG